MQNSKVARSPYAKFKKVPHKYGPSYHAWLEASNRFGIDSPQAIQADALFRQLHGIPPRGSGAYQHV